jgi:MFS family permease
LSARREYRLLAALTTINLLNFVDRQVLFAVFPAVKEELGLRDAELGLAASAFILVYMMVTPIAGYLGDRFHRPRIIALSVALWSAATLASGAARSFAALLVSRALVGIGESSYAPLSSAMIGDSFPAGRRGSSLGIFNVAVPVGSALGYVVGGLIAARFGWRAAFYVVGIPGLALAVTMLALHDPRRGAMDRSFPSGGTMSALLTDRVYVVTTAAQAALTFVLGALAAWLPTFLVRLHGLSIGVAAGGFGILTAVTGLVGTGLGGWLGDRAVKHDPRGHLRVSAFGLLLAAPAAALAIATDDRLVFWSATAIAEILVFLNVGPLTAVIVGVAAPSIRATAVAANILAMHLFGDAVSPWVVGVLSDRFGIRRALAIMPPMLVLSGILCLVAARYVSRESRRE